MELLFHHGKKVTFFLFVQNFCCDTLVLSVLSILPTLVFFSFVVSYRSLRGHLPYSNHNLND